MERSHLASRDRLVLVALARAGLTGPALQRTLAELTKLATQVIGVPVALVSLVEEDRQVFVDSHGLPEPWATRGETGLSHSFCRLVVQDGAPLVVEDARRDARTADILAVRDLGVIAYAGTPLRDSDGHVLGSVCAIDTEPHAWTPEELLLLEGFNAVVAGLIEDRAGMSSETREQQSVHAQRDEMARRLQRDLLLQVEGELAERVVSYYQRAANGCCSAATLPTCFSIRMATWDSCSVTSAATGLSRPRWPSVSERAGRRSRAAVRPWRSWSRT